MEEGFDAAELKVFSPWLPIEDDWEVALGWAACVTFDACGVTEEPIPGKAEEAGASPAAEAADEEDELANKLEP